jgi:acyl carrier protein
MAAIPQTPTGKTDRLALPPPAPARSDLDGPLKAPRNAIELDLVAIWKEILGVEQLGIDDDFLSLGGDSVKAAQIAAYAAFRFRLDVPASAPLLLETVARMAEMVAAGTGTHRGNDAAIP